MSFEELQMKLREFNDQREWGRFHSPKNLVMALAGEVGELNALLQWVPEDDVAEWLADPDHEAAMASEIADVLAYLVLLADAVGVDPVLAGLDKIELNQERYPVDRARGTSAKYTEL
jgi:NTP pyrophosphatase (non-canonical NTP hydrolase)